jgi:hypothetical protein
MVETISSEKIAAVGKTRNASVVFHIPSAKILGSKTMAVSITDERQMKTVGSPHTSLN